MVQKVKHKISKNLKQMGPKSVQDTMDEDIKSQKKKLPEIINILFK